MHSRLLMDRSIGHLCAALVCILCDVDTAFCVTSILQHAHIHRHKYTLATNHGLYFWCRFLMEGLWKEIVRAPQFRWSGPLFCEGPHRGMWSKKVSSYPTFKRKQTILTFQNFFFLNTLEPSIPQHSHTCIFDVIRHSVHTPCWATRFYPCMAYPFALLWRQIGTIQSIPEG
jgi:hypothetical protein